MTAGSVPLRILSAGAAEHVLTGLKPHFTAATGVAVETTFGTIARVRQRLAEGFAADLVIGTTPAIRQLEQEGRLHAGSAVELGRTRTGICVKSGARVPDISTAEKLRTALLAARSFAYTDPAAGGTSGIFLTGLMDRLGILDAMKRKAVLCINGEDVVTRVVSGEAELGSTFISEFFLVPGVTSAGPLPAEIGNATSYSAALHAACTQPDAARRMIAMLTEPARRQTWLDGGFEPAA